MQEHMNKKAATFCSSRPTRRGSNKALRNSRSSAWMKARSSYRPNTTLSLGRARRRSPGEAERARMERGLSRREKARRGGGRKEEKGGTEDSKGQGIKGGPETKRGRPRSSIPTNHLSRACPHALFLPAVLFLFSHFLFFFSINLLSRF